MPLAQIGSAVLVESELEFELHENQTLLALEHTEIHYLGFESVQLRAGVVDHPGPASGFRATYDDAPAI